MYRHPCRRSRHRLSPRPFCAHPFYPFFHSAHVLAIFFTLLSTAVYNLPLPTSCHYSLTLPSCAPIFDQFPFYQPFPSSSICAFLNRLSVSFLSSSHPIVFLGLKSRRFTRNYFLLLLLLAGDIQVNPGPTS